MYSLHFLDKENDLNKIIKKQKRDKQNISILFISLWDDYCASVVDKIKKKYKNKEGEPLYVVDSFQMPHSFVIYQTTKLPHLVRLRTDNAMSEDYLPNIFKSLKIT